MAKNKSHSKQSQKATERNRENIDNMHHRFSAK